MNFELPCPHCATVTVVALDEGFSSTTVEVWPCKALKAEQPALMSYRIKKSAALRLAEEGLR